MNGVINMKKNNKKSNNYKEIHVNIGELLSSKRDQKDIELIAANLKRKMNRKKRHENMLNHKDDK